MTDLERAMADVAFIQQRLAASTRFDGLAPHAVAATGLLALVAAAAQTLWPAQLAGDPIRFVQFWSVIALVAVMIIGGEALIRAQRLHGSMADLLIAGTLSLSLPFITAGGALAIILLRFAPAAAWALPGLWQMLIALFGFSAATILPRTIIWPASWYFACAGAVLALGAQGGALDPWLMGVPFGVGQILAGLMFARTMRRGHG